MELIKLCEISAPLLGCHWIVLLIWMIFINVIAHALSLSGSQPLSLDLLLVERGFLWCEERALQELKARFSQHVLSVILRSGIVSILRGEGLFGPDFKLCVVKGFLNFLIPFI